MPSPADDSHLGPYLERDWSPSRETTGKPRNRDALLEQVKRRGTHLRRRRRSAIGAMVVAVSGVLLVPMLASLGDDGRNVSADGATATSLDQQIEAAPMTAPSSTFVPGGRDKPLQTTTTQSVGTAPTTSEESMAPGAPGSSSQAAVAREGNDKGEVEAAAPPLGSSPSTTDPRCHQSFDPACGQFSWDGPLAPNVSPVMTLTTSPDPPRAGQTVSFAFIVQDADGPVGDECFEFETGDGAIYSIVGGEQVTGPPSCATPTCAAPSGPWAVPERRVDEKTFTILHTYVNPGELRLHISSRADGSGNCTVNPYADAFDVSYRVSVLPRSSGD